MFNQSSKILFLTMMITGTLITVTANSWLGAWMGLEINLLSFIPLLSETNNFKSSEASLNYFITQALASTVLLFSVILMMMKNNMNMEISESFFSSIMISTLLLKSGAAPFHFWFPNLMEGLTWMNALLLMTWQKIAPLMLISYLNLNNLMIFSIILSATFGALGGLNQTSLRKLMAYSSINHLGWMLSALMINEMIWLIYFIFYSFLTFILIFMFNNFKLFHLNQLFSWFIPSKNLKFTLFFNFLSLGGLPPFLGIFPKWIVIQQMTFSNQYLLLTILMMTTLITLFFYLRICYSAFMLNYSEINWILNFNYNKQKMNLYLIFPFFSIFGLFLISMIYMML